jgi:hypothetical protein
MVVVLDVGAPIIYINLPNQQQRALSEASNATGTTDVADAPNVTEGSLTITVGAFLAVYESVAGVQFSSLGRS